ncbi:thioesterase family protein [Gramella jeungdoensis]|uniref:Thioesterase family protein n=1 Tax=Gramella jeungdoensis TaxID=708091 RepID=A0ABT0Z238_9FLAO|nr:thioesterase family protein [Gramella jeungdoensis]MCM8569793.1 thioesterase family protein [Gramella jeungdoensis]
MYSKKFEIRWSDLDANRHLANSAFINFMSHTRMGFLMENGFGHEQLSHYNLGPIVFYEHIYYFKEIFAGEPVRVTLELNGLSEDGKYFEFIHNIYDHNGINCATCEMMGSWIDLEKRKLTSLPGELYDKLDLTPKSKTFRTLTKEDTRKYGKRPHDLSKEELESLK